MLVEGESLLDRQAADDDEAHTIGKAPRLAAVLLIDEERLNEIIFGDPFESCNVPLQDLPKKHLTTNGMAALSRV